MAVRTTVDIPEPLHNALRQRAEKSGASIRSLIVRAVQQAYTEPAGNERVTGPMVRGTGKLGPRFPKDDNPHDLIFS